MAAPYGATIRHLVVAPHRTTIRHLVVDSGSFGGQPLCRRHNRRFPGDGRMDGGLDLAKKAGTQLIFCHQMKNAPHILFA